jgi:hypothetical protein
LEFTSEDVSLSMYSLIAQLLEKGGVAMQIGVMGTDQVTKDSCCAWADAVIYQKSCF